MHKQFLTPTALNPNTWDLGAYDSQAQRYSRMDLQTMRSQRTLARYLCSPRAVYGPTELKSSVRNACVAAVERASARAW